MQRRSNAFVAVVTVITSIVLGCGRATPIPADAQRVHVVITGSAVTLEPSVVRAGDVYLVLEEPQDGSFSFVERQTAAGETPGPLTEHDLERLALGDTQGMSIGGSDAGGCDAAQNAEDRGQMGPCGNVMRFVVGPGLYAVVSGDLDVDPTTGEPPRIAVLEVIP